MNKILQSTVGMLLTVFFTTVVVMSVYETCKELIFKETLAPWESHAITILFTSILAAFTGALLRLRVLEIAHREKQLEIDAQKSITLRLVLRAVHHIVSNFVNHFQLAQLEIEEQGRVNDETIELLREGFRETKEQLAVLEHLDDPTDEKAYRKIYPA